MYCDQAARYILHLYAVRMRVQQPLCETVSVVPCAQSARTSSERMGAGDETSVCDVIASYIKYRTNLGRLSDGSYT